MSQRQLKFYETIKSNIKFQFVLIAICIWLLPTTCLTEVQTRFHDLTQSSKATASNKLDDPDVNLNENDKFSEGAKHKLPDDILKGLDKSADKDDSPIKAGFLDAFTASISVILFTELGDKTFFIAAIMAMRHPRLIVFGGALSALALMTVLSVVFGMAATIIPKIYTYYISTGLFAIFGLKMIYEGYSMKENEAQEELEEVQSHLRKREDELFRVKLNHTNDQPTIGHHELHTDNGIKADVPLNSFKIITKANNNNNNDSSKFINYDDVHHHQHHHINFTAIIMQNNDNKKHHDNNDDHHQQNVHHSQDIGNDAEFFDNGQSTRIIFYSSPTLTTLPSISQIGNNKQHHHYHQNNHWDHNMLNVNHLELKLMMNHAKSIDTNLSKRIYQMDALRQQYISMHHSLRNMTNNINLDINKNGITMSEDKHKILSQQMNGDKKLHDANTINNNNIEMVRIYYITIITI